MVRRRPGSTRTVTRCPYTTRFRSRDQLAGGRAPDVEAGASVNRRRQSTNGSLPIASIPGMEATQTIYDVGFDAAWELDLFGANRRALEGATARLHATGIEAEGVRMRSEEHTSELQSLMRISYAVFCLKKKNTNKESSKHETTQ